MVNISWKKKTARFVGFEMGQSEWFPLQTPNKSKSLEPTTEDDSYYTIYHATEMVESWCKHRKHRKASSLFKPFSLEHNLKESHFL